MSDLSFFFYDRVPIKFCVFSFKFFDFFLNLPVLSPMIDLPSGGPSVKQGVHTMTPRESRKILENNTIFNESPVYVYVF